MFQAILSIFGAFLGAQHLRSVETLFFFRLIPDPYTSNNTIHSFSNILDQSHRSDMVARQMFKLSVPTYVQK